MNQNGIIIPGFRYKDAPAMIEWLEKAFGFEKHLVVEGENNTIEHAQLTLGNSMIMLGSEKHQRDYDQLCCCQFWKRFVETRPSSGNS